MKKAAMTPARFEDLAIHIQTSASTLSQRYSLLHDLANSRQVSGSGEKVSGGGTSDTSSTIVSNERALDDLGSAGEFLEHAWSSLTAAHGKLTAIERTAEERAERAEQAQPAERLREAPATRGALVQVLIRNKAGKIAEHAAEMEALDERIRPLFHHVDADDAEDVIRTMETRIRQIRADGEREANRLEREVRRLRGVVVKVKEQKDRERAKAKQPASQWQKGA